MSENTQVRAGGYLRISSDPKDKRAGVTRQREDVTTLCDVKGWSLVNFYEDNDKSASNGKERPAWDRLLADIKDGRIDAIAAWDQDRGWRMMAELEALRKFFDSVGRPILFATTGQGDIDLRSPTGILAVQIKTAVSEHEIAMMRTRQLRAARQRAEQGRPKWKRAFGYMPTPDGPKPDPAVAPLVVDMFRSIMAGASLGAVAADLNKAGALGLNGKPWDESKVGQFIRNPRSAGLRAHNGELVGDGRCATWEPLVSEAMWRAACASLDARPSAGRGKRRTMRKHLLSGLLICGKCESHMNARHRGRGVLGYCCVGCHGVTLRADDVEPLVLKTIGQRLAREDAVDLLKANSLNPDEAQAITDQKAELHAEIRQFAVDLGKKLLTSEQVKIATDIVQEQLDALERKEQDQERLRVLDGIPLGTPEAVAAVGRLSHDRFRAVLSLICRITVKPVGKGLHSFDPRRIVFDPI